LVINRGVNFAPVTQSFAFLLWRGIVESEGAFQEQRKRWLMNVIVFSEHRLGLVSETLNGIDVIFALTKVG